MTAILWFLACSLVLVVCVVAGVAMWRFTWEAMRNTQSRTEPIPDDDIQSFDPDVRLVRSESFWLGRRAIYEIHYEGKVYRDGQDMPTVEYPSGNQTDKKTSQAVWGKVETALELRAQARAVKERRREWGVE